MDKSYIRELLKPTHGPGCTCSWHAPEPEPSPTQDGAGDGDGQEGEAAESNGKKQKPSTTQNTKKQDPKKPSSSQDAEQTTPPSAETSSAQGPAQKSSQTSSQSGNQSDDSAESGKEKTPEAPDSGTSESERASQDDQQDTSQDQDSEPQESECTSDPSMDSEDKQQTSSSTSSTTDENSSGSTETEPCTSDETDDNQDGGDSSEEPAEQEDQQQTQQSSESDQSSTSTGQGSTSTENDDPKAQSQSGGMCQEGGSSSPGAGTTTPPQAGAGGSADTSGSQGTGGTSTDQEQEQSNSTQQSTTDETQTSKEADSDSAYTPPSPTMAPITMSSQDQEALEEMLSEKSDNADYEAEIQSLANQYPQFEEKGTKFDMNELRDMEDRDLDMDKMQQETWCSTNYKQNLAWGRDYRRPDKVKSAYAQPVTKDLARALHKMIDNEVGNGIYESQRIDGGKLIAQMQSRNLNLARCRREEMHREKLLILCDISVSCEEVCNEMTAAAYRIIDLDPRLNIIFHSNNALVEITGQDVDSYVVDQLTKLNVLTGVRDDGNGQYIGQAPMDEGAEAWRELLAYLSTKTVLAFGDTDAIYIYEQVIAAGMRFFYLGNGHLKGDVFYNNWGVPFENKYPNTQIVATMGGADSPKKALSEVVEYLTRGIGRIDNGVRIG